MALEGVSSTVRYSTLRVVTFLTNLLSLFDSFDSSLVVLQLALPGKPLGQNKSKAKRS